MPADSVRPRHRVRVWYRPMRSRDPRQEHRPATPLELLFDLCFVVAVGRAAAELHHAVSANHIGDGVLGFVLAFFAIWWAWLQFTWFASAFDTDDVPYRIATLVQIAGGLIIAAGVERAFAGDFTIVVLGYVVMRLALVSQWLRVAATDPGMRPAALRYAGGITAVQVAWIGRLALPDGLLLPAFLVLAAADLLVPIWAERASATNWHPGHIGERYGLFTIIVLGEAVISGTAAVQEGLETGQHVDTLITVAFAGLVIMFAMWWLYFDQPAEPRLRTFWRTFAWGYGHLLIFASAAAVGAGIEVAIDYYTHHTELATLPAGMALTVPVAVFLLSVWLMHVGPGNECRPIAYGFPVAVLLVLGASFTPAPVRVTAGILVLLVATVVIATHGEPVPGSEADDES